MNGCQFWKSREEKHVSDATFSAELLANYCDMLLRKTPLSKKLSSDEVEAKLRDVLLVLKYVQNKDVFMRSVQLHITVYGYKFNRQFFVASSFRSNFYVFNCI